MRDQKKTLKQCIAITREVSETWLRKLISPFIYISRRLIIPGFKGVPLYDVIVFFIRGLKKSSIIMRANALTFSAILAFVPAIIFLFSLFPFIPVPDLQVQILNSLREALPDEVYLTIRSTIEDILTNQRSGLLSLSLVISLYFASNGIIGVIRSFNQSAHAIETRSALQIRILSIVLVFLVSLIMIISAGLLSFSTFILEILQEHDIIRDNLMAFLLRISSWIVLFLIVLVTVSTLYYLAPAKRGIFPFISPGSVLTALLTIAFFALFGFYADRTQTYNRFYGSLETIFILLVWINLSSHVLLVGFEVNGSIFTAKRFRS